MKPLINLKSFLAALLILIVPAALLVAYFRNYSTEGAGHEHSEKGKADGADTGKGEMSAMKPGGDSKAAMGHGNMAMPQGGKMQPQQQAEMSQPAAQPQKDGGHAAMRHGSMAEPSTAQSQPQQAPATPQLRAAAPASAPTGAEPMQEGMNAMGRVKDLTSSGKSTEVARLLHAGAKDFFLDHTQHITLSAEQKKKLNQIKEQALLDKASADRKILEAEQQLWKSTSADRPDAEEIEKMVRQVEKLRADQRIGFIRAVDQAVKVLTAEQHQAVLGGSEVSTHSPNK